MFVCYQDGKRCSSYGYKSWEEDSFDNKREAEVYCFNWAYPYGKSFAIENAPQMDVGVEYDYSMSEFSVMMSIREENI